MSIVVELCWQKNKRDEKIDKGEKERKHLDSARDSDRTLLSPSKSDLLDSEDLSLCDELWPVCDECVFHRYHHCCNHMYVVHHPLY